MDLVKCLALIKDTRDNNGDIFIYGSGLNAELASHANVDWIKFANVKTVEVGIPTLTAYANDYAHRMDLQNFLMHRAFGRNCILVGINLGEIDEGLNEAFKFSASAGGVNILITNNKHQLEGDIHGHIFINTTDFELASDIAQTFTHYIGTNLAQDIDPTFINDWTNSFNGYASYLCKTLESSKFSEERLKLIAALVDETLSAKRSIFTFGNGGSAAMAAYFTESLQAVYKKHLKPFRDIINVSAFHHTIKNSIKEGSYKEDIYTSILGQLGVSPGDTLIGISTSGNSNNIIHPFISFPQLKKIAVLGFGDGGILGSMPSVDHTIIVPNVVHKSYAIAEDGQRIAMTAIIKHLKYKLNHNASSK